MPNKKNKYKKELRIIILVFVGSIAFFASIITNIIGFKQVINKESDRSGFVGFTVRKSGSDSLGNQKETKVDNKGKIVEEDILINSLPIIKLNNNGWDRVKAVFSNFQLDDDNNAVFSDGYVLYCNGKYVNYVVFDNTYKDEVVGHLKVGTDFKTIEKTLGVPTFKSKKYLGYKTKEIYVFFYEDEISIYRNKKLSNKELEELFISYLEKNYDKDRTHLVVDIRNNYEDFTIELDNETNTVILTSIARQIVAKLDSLGNIEIELYDGYNIANETTQSYIDKKIISLNEEDLVQIVEDERVSGN